MAVYTHLGAEALAELIGHFDVGALVSAKGIAEGVSNSNWLIETDGTGSEGSRFILTVYEARTDARELPFFLGLLDHLAARGCPVPRTIHDRAGASHRTVIAPDGGTRAAALIEFLPGVSVSEPTPVLAESVGAALAQVHLAAAEFAGTRFNDFGAEAWGPLAVACGADGFSQIDAGLAGLVGRELESLSTIWPNGLPTGIIHADLFPDNVLIRNSRVTGLIDFYFACRDILAYDVAVTHAAWCFSMDGRRFLPDVSAALLRGYAGVRKLSAAEHAALPCLARGACLRFLLTRAFDWLNTPADALVTRKDPLDFARRLEFYAAAGATAFAHP